MMTFLINFAFLLIWLVVVGAGDVGQTKHTHLKNFVQSAKADNLVVMIDSIKLKEIKQHDSKAFALALNYLFAMEQSYDFVYVYVNKQQMLTSCRTLYNITHVPAHGGKLHTHSSAHDLDVGAFHPGLKQLRATPWMKLPVLWNISKFGVLGKRYNKILYLSMDSAMNPMVHRSISDSYSIWLKPESVVKGSHIKSSSVVFFSNYPYYPRPYTDTLLINGRTNRSHEVFMSMWNANATSRNFMPFFDRTVLWKAIENRDRFIRLTSYVHSERQFPPCESHWVCSMPNIYYKSRYAAFRAMYANLTKNSSNVFDIVRLIRANRTIEFEMMKTVAKMWKEKPSIWTCDDSTKGTPHSKSKQVVHKVNKTEYPAKEEEVKLPLFVGSLSDANNNNTYSADAVLSETSAQSSPPSASDLTSENIKQHETVAKRSPSLFTRVRQFFASIINFFFG